MGNEITLEHAKVHQATNHQLIIQGASIFVHEDGQGAPVLFLHGSPDSHEMWLPLIGYLHNEVRCLAPDLPGFGQSTLPTKFALTLDNMADFIHELVAALGVSDPVALVTTDFGGHYGLAFMVKYPNLVCCVAISNTNFFADYKWHFFARLYRIPVIGELLLATTSKSMLRQTYRKMAPAIPDSYVDKAYDMSFGSAAVRKTILRMYRSRDSKDFIGWQDRLLDMLEQVPAIVLWGDKDPFIDPQYADRFAKAQVYHFAEYSHWLPLEAPAEYGSTLLSWLRQLPRP